MRAERRGMRAKVDDGLAHLAVPRFLVPGVCALLFAFTYLTAVLTMRGQKLENDALSAASVPHGEPLLLALVSVPDLFIALVIVVTIGLVRRRKDAALAALLVLVVSNMATQLFKYTLLSRPDFSTLLTDNTFPSGHTTAYLSVTIAILIVVPRRLRPVFAAIGALATSAAAIELMNFGWHRLSDIVGAVLLVTTVASLAVALIRPRDVPVVAERQVPLVTSVLSAVAAVALLAGGGFALASRVADGSRDRLLLIGTECIATAAVCVAFVAVGWVLARWVRSPEAGVGPAARSGRARRRTRAVPLPR